MDWRHIISANEKNGIELTCILYRSATNDGNVKSSHKRRYSWSKTDMPLVHFWSASGIDWCCCFFLRMPSAHFADLNCKWFLSQYIMRFISLFQFYFDWEKHKQIQNKQKLKQNNLKICEIFVEPGKKMKKNKKNDMFVAYCIRENAKNT